MGRIKMHIVACLDSGFVMPTGVMMYSVCANNLEVNIDFHLVVDESVTDSDKNDLVNTVCQFKDTCINFYDISSRLSAVFPLYKDEWLTRSTYYRLFLTEILPKSIDKVLYLDGDCIVRKSLIPLWNTDLSENAVGAVFDGAEGNIEYYNRLRYPPQLGYFNAGVLLINLSFWRYHNVLKLFIDYIESHSERIKCEDQDVMNVVFQRKKVFVPAKYNVQTFFLRRVTVWDYWKHESEINEAISDPVIVHYTTKDKPWIAYSHHPNPFSGSFYKYQDQTKWKGVRYETRNMKRRFKNFIGDSLRYMRILSPLRSIYIDVLPVDEG